jgi:hypothetical protein
MSAMAPRCRKFVASRMPATLTTTPLLPLRQNQGLNAAGNRPVSARAAAIRMALNRVALIADAVASSAATETMT